MSIRIPVRSAIPVLFGLFGFFTPFSIAGAHISLSLAVVFVLIDGDSRRHLFRLFRTHPIAKPLAAWCLLSVVAVVFAEDVARSFPKLKKLALIPLVGIGALPVVRNALRPILAALIASMAFVAIWGLVVHIEAGGGVVARLRGISGYYMTVAGLLMVVGLITAGELLSALKDPRPRRLAFLVGSGLVVFLALLGTYTRGAWAGFAAGLILLLRRRRGALMGLALVAALLLLLGPESGRERALSALEPGHRDNVVRIATWKHGLQMIGEHPLTGVGLVIPERLLAEGAFTTPEGATLVPHSHMHNAYLQVAVGMGLPALAVFVWMIVAFFRIGRGAARSPIRSLWEEGLIAAYPAALVALLVNGLFEWNFGDSEVLGLFYFVSGAVLGLEERRTEPLGSTGE
jgi:O-antigen ligase